MLGISNLLSNLCQPAVPTTDWPSPVVCPPSYFILPSFPLFSLHPSLLSCSSPRCEEDRIGHLLVPTSSITEEGHQPDVWLHIHTAFMNLKRADSCSQGERRGGFRCRIEGTFLHVLFLPLTGTFSELFSRFFLPLLLLFLLLEADLDHV